MNYNNDNNHSYGKSLILQFTCLKVKIFPLLICLQVYGKWMIISILLFNNCTFFKEKLSSSEADKRSRGERIDLIATNILFIYFVHFDKKFSSW
jgi:hypothetical protein